MRRREVITLLGGVAATRPLPARAQQPTPPVVGLLAGTSRETFTDRLHAFRQGLRESGYVEAENVAMEYRWADNRTDRLRQFAAELVDRNVNVIVATGGLASAYAAKAATTTIPIVFGVGIDPVAGGLVSSLARPGGNLTGVYFFSTDLSGKRLELLRELVPSTTRVAVLVNPTSVLNTETTLRDVEPAARAVGLMTQVFNASTSREIDLAFTALVRNRCDALFVGQDVLFVTRRLQLANMAARHGLPTTSGSRDLVEVGGLMSYGTNIADAHRQIGLYTGRILKGAKPADLPVVQSTKFELVINAQTARMLGLTVPDKLLVTADEVIE
ncbi:MAG: ABC transporter substrate-binding protein [Xanthobacteraceae bacterium]